MTISAVKLRNSYKICFIDQNNIFLKQNTECIIETENGLDIGTFIKIEKPSCMSKVKIEGKLIRKANDDDIKTIPEIEAIEEKAFIKCKEKAENKNMDMKLISVKSLFDKTKIIFYFVAENRVDFRELVRELASVFKTRIEMRQIGVRDKARLIGGFGQCGRELCCCHQCHEFDPVSIKMAKEQNLNLNSLKISGMCGRLLCCLSYEYETYTKLNKGMPKYGAEIIAGDKKYNVITHNSLRESFLIKDRDRYISISKHDVEFIENKYHIKKDKIESIFNPKEDIPKEDNTDPYKF